MDSSTPQPTIDPLFQCNNQFEASLIVPVIENRTWKQVINDIIEQYTLYYQHKLNSPPPPPAAAAAIATTTDDDYDAAAAVADADERLEIRTAAAAAAAAQTSSSSLSKINTPQAAAAAAALEIIISVCDFTYTPQRFNLLQGENLQCCVLLTPLQAAFTKTDNHDSDVSPTVPAGTVPAGAVPAGTVPDGTIPADAAPRPFSLPSLSTEALNKTIQAVCISADLVALAVVTAAAAAVSNAAADSAASINNPVGVQQQQQQQQQLPVETSVLRRHFWDISAAPANCLQTARDVDGASLISRLDVYRLRLPGNLGLLFIMRIPLTVSQTNLNQPLSLAVTLNSSQFGTNRDEAWLSQSDIQTERRQALPLSRAAASLYGGGETPELGLLVPEAFYYNADFESEISISCTTAKLISADLLLSERRFYRSHTTTTAGAGAADKETGVSSSSSSSTAAAGVETMKMEDSLGFVVGPDRKSVLLRRLDKIVCVSEALRASLAGVTADSVFVKVANVRFDCTIEIQDCRLHNVNSPVWSDYPIRLGPFDCFYLPFSLEQLEANLLLSYSQQKLISLKQYFSIFAKTLMDASTDNKNKITDNTKQQLQQQQLLQHQQQSGLLDGSVPQHLQLTGSPQQQQQQVLLCRLSSAPAVRDSPVGKLLTPTRAAPAAAAGGGEFDCLIPHVLPMVIKWCVPDSPLFSPVLVQSSIVLKLPFRAPLQFSVSGFRSTADETECIAAAVDSRTCKISSQSGSPERHNNNRRTKIPEISDQGTATVPIVFLVSVMMTVTNYTTDSVDLDCYLENLNDRQKGVRQKQQSGKETPPAGAAGAAEAAGAAGGAVPVDDEEESEETEFLLPLQGKVAVGLIQSGKSCEFELQYYATRRAGVYRIPRIMAKDTKSGYEFVVSGGSVAV